MRRRFVCPVFVCPVLALVMALAACSKPHESGVYLAQVAVPCPAVDALNAQRSSEPLPAGFSPVAVVRCTMESIVGGPGSSLDAKGLEWAAATRSTGPFDELVRALRHLPNEPGRDRVCPANYVPPFLLVLIDASGRAVQPALPQSRCGGVSAEVRSALDALPWTPLANRR